MQLYAIEWKFNLLVVIRKFANLTIYLFGVDINFFNHCVELTLLQRASHIHLTMAGTTRYENFLS